MIRNFEQFVNERNAVPTLSDEILKMSPDYQDKQLRKYVEKYYNHFSDDFQHAKEDGSATLNWGEFESGSPEDNVANYVCDLIAAHDMDDRPISPEEQDLVDRAWKIADDYVNGR